MPLFKNKEFSIAGNTKPSKSRGRRSKKVHEGEDNDSGEDYPTTNKMSGLYDLPNADDDDESEEGWSDDSGKDSDAFEKSHPGKGKYTSNLPTMNEGPGGAGIFNDDFDDEDSDEDDYHAKSALGGMGSYLNARTPPKNRSTGPPPPPAHIPQAHIPPVQPVRSPPSPPNAPGFNYANHNAVEPPGQSLPPQKSLQDPDQYLGYRGLDSHRKRVPPTAPPPGAYPDPMDDPDYFRRQTEQQRREEEASRDRSPREMEIPVPVVASRPPPPQEQRPAFDPPPKGAKEAAGGYDDYGGSSGAGGSFDGAAAAGAGAAAGGYAGASGTGGGGGYANGGNDSYEDRQGGYPQDNRPYKDYSEQDLEAPSHAITRDATLMADRSIVSEELQKSKRTTLCLLIWFVLVLVCLAALAGGLVGYFLFGGGSNNGSSSTPETTPAPTPSPFIRTQAPNSTPAPVATAPTGPAPTRPATSAPGPAPTPATASPVTGAPTSAPVGTGTSAPTPCVPNPFAGITCSAITDAPTPGTEGIVTNQALYDTIAAADPQGGQTILEEGTPQSLAYVSIQNEAETLNLSNERWIQRYAMRTFFYSTGGTDTWKDSTGWETSNDECSWFTSSASPVCNGETLEILEFNTNGLIGTLPPQVAMLTGLKRLYIKGSESVDGLTGGIPEEYAQLTNMEVFLLNDQFFTEPLPSGLFASWPRATLVNIVDSSMPGEIPATVSGLTEVTNFNMAGNALSGKIPDGINSMTKLNLLSLADNGLTGPVPAGISALGSLRFLDFGDNALTGPITAEIGTLTQLKGGLILSNNDFSGPLPPELNNLVQLGTLLLNNNGFTGPLPDISGLVNLKEFRIEGNSITGTVDAGSCAALNSVPAKSYADCLPGGDLVCDCCTKCCEEGVEVCQ